MAMQHAAIMSGREAGTQLTRDLVMLCRPAISFVQVGKESLAADGITYGINIDIIHRGNTKRLGDGFGVWAVKVVTEPGALATGSRHSTAAYRHTFASQVECRIRSLPLAVL